MFGTVNVYYFNGNEIKFCIDSGQDFLLPTSGEHRDDKLGQLGQHCRDAKQNTMNENENYITMVGT